MAPSIGSIAKGVASKGLVSGKNAVGNAIKQRREQAGQVDPNEEAPLTPEEEEEIRKEEAQAQTSDIVRTLITSGTKKLIILLGPMNVAIGCLVAIVVLCLLIMLIMFLYPNLTGTSNTANADRQFEGIMTVARARGCSDDDSDCIIESVCREGTYMYIKSTEGEAKAERAFEDCEEMVKDNLPQN